MSTVVETVTAASPPLATMLLACHRTCANPTSSVMIILKRPVRYTRHRATTQQKDSGLIVNTDLDRAPGATSTSDGDALLQAIRSRRSIGKMTGEAPDQAAIRQVVEAGTWGPNHHQTEPWRFVVLEGEARSELGRVMGGVAAGRETDPERKVTVATNAASKPLRSPYVVAICVEPSPDPSVPEIEEIAAVSAGAQNMLLAAHALGLAAIWRSGWIAFEPEVRDFLGLSARGKVLGFLYLGYPAMSPPARQRRSVDDVTTWKS
jgi:nitroreductase